MNEQKNSEILTMSLQKEIDHRIKNNLNMISSILGLQILSLKNDSSESSEEVLKKSKLRIDALAMIHDALHLSQKSQQIDFAYYVSLLNEKINKIFSKKLKVKVDAEKIDLSLETMIELGIILNELLTNSVKYANHNIEIKLTKKHKHCTLEYLEKGNKTANLHKIKESKKLGLKLVKLMVKQMKAAMDIKQNGNLGYTIRFVCDKKPQ